MFAALSFRTLARAVPLLGILTTLSSVSEAAPRSRARSMQTSMRTPSGERWNVLWLVAEDMGTEIAAYGDKTVKTPNLDRLAAEGVTYTNAFAVVGVCAPSRASIITGKYPTRIGAQNMRTNAKGLAHVKPYEAVPPPEVKCFTEFVRAQGYYAANNPKEDYQFARPITAWDESSKTAHYKNRKPGQPFFQVFNFMETHESQIWSQADEPLTVDPKKVKLPPYYPDTPTVRQDVARYYDNIYHLDIEIGEKLRELEAAGQMDKTIIFFYGDHGLGLPRGKREVYDTGLRVPLLVRFPDRRRAGEKDDSVVTLMDLGPTVMSIVGAQVPDWMDGKAFLGPQSKKREHFMAFRDRMDEVYDMSRAVRDGRFKYIRHYQPLKPVMQDLKFRKNIAMMREWIELHEAGKLNEVQDQYFRPRKEGEELFDTKTDPHEIKNLAKDPRYQKELTRLRLILDDYIAEEPDWGFTPESEMVEAFWPGGVQPTTAVPSMERYHGMLLIRSATEGASIAYQVGDQIGTDNWSLYHEPLKLEKGTKVRAVAIRIGYKQSAPRDGLAP